MKNWHRIIESHFELFAVKLKICVHGQKKVARRPPSADEAAAFSNTTSAFLSAHWPIFLLLFLLLIIFPIFSTFFSILFLSPSREQKKEGSGDCGGEKMENTSGFIQILPGFFFRGFGKCENKNLANRKKGESYLMKEFYRYYFLKDLANLFNLKKHSLLIYIFVFLIFDSAEESLEV
jgi:hypothetical protein